MAESGTARACCVSGSATARACWPGGCRRGLGGARHVARPGRGRPRRRMRMFRFDRDAPLPPAAFAGRDACPGLGAARRRRATRCSTRTPTTSPRCPASPGSAICRRPASMATAAAAGSTRRRSCARAASAAGAGSRPRPDGSICGGGDGVPVHIFRLAAIYGPGRSPFEALRAGTAKRIDKPGQVFSRIHVEDLASVLAASIARPRPGAVYNVCDDEPAAARGGRRPCRRAARASSRRRWCRSKKPGCRRWRAASRTTTSGCRTR